MAIKTYSQDGKKLYEVYINGSDSRGIRVQRRKKGIDTLRKAQNAEFEFKHELAKLRNEIAPYKWEEWLMVCLKRMKLSSAFSTVINYEKLLEKWISPLWTGMDISEINKSAVHEAIFEKCSSDLTPSSRKTILKMVRRIFQLAVDDGLIDRNPCSGISIKVPESDLTVLTNKEALLFLKEAKLCNHRFYQVWVVALMTGMRSGELYALKWTDVDFEAEIISVSRAWNNKNGFCPTKTQKSRAVPISEDLGIFLKELKLQTGETEFVLPRIWEWENGEQSRITREFCQSIGITSVRFHDLRATFITNLLSRGVSLARVMAIVGHSQIKTTNGYLRKAGVEVKGATDSLGYTVPQAKAGKLLSLVRG